MTCKLFVDTMFTFIFVHLMSWICNLCEHQPVRDSPTTNHNPRIG